MYALLNGLIYVIKKVSMGRIVPQDADAAEYWTYKPGGHPPWFIRAIHGQLWRTGSYGDVGAEARSDHGTEASGKELVEGIGKGGIRVYTLEE